MALEQLSLLGQQTLHGHGGTDICHHNCSDRPENCYTASSAQEKAYAYLRVNDEYHQEIDDFHQENSVSSQATYDILSLQVMLSGNSDDLLCVS